MTFLSKVLARFSRLPKRLSTRKSVQELSHIHEESIQKPPEDTEVETEERDCEVSSAEMEIFGEKLQLFPNTVEEPLMILVAPLHPATVEEERPPERRGTRKSKKERGENSKTPPPSTVQNDWMETCNMQVAPSEVETPPFTSTIVAESPMIQVAPLHPGTVEEERPPERRGTRKSKKERGENSKTPPPSTIWNAWMETCNMQVTHPENERLEDNIRREKRTKMKRKNDHPEQSTPPPTKVKLAWIETSNTQVSHAQSTKAEEDSEPETMVEILTVAKEKIKKERKIEYWDEIPPPATTKLAWMETSNTQVTHLEERRPKRKENEQQESITLIEYIKEDNSPKEHKTKDRKTEQAKNTPPAAKEKCVQMGGDIKRESSRLSHVQKKEPAVFHIYTMSELKAYEKKMKKKMKEEQKQTQSANEPSLKDGFINRFKKYI
ncbi:hypothetical protein DPX16_8420 [Anabarilius grahami]|uniref:Uncharacterized protein n=1 Tax=Anabarilius grahami TaxID=495550 RepID=A0A3N0Z300_ANAGA|nr:hypothetical protein DPX16_8420 [Anabarilius grahami]